MIKPNSIRAAIVKHLTALEREPERLQIWADKGSIKSWPGNLNFEYSYQLNISVENFTDDPSALMIIIVAWLKSNQPDLLGNKDGEGFRFVVDFVDDKMVDLSIELDLMEKVIVTERPDGAHDLQHIGEPNPIFDDDIACSEPPAILREVYRQGSRIIPTHNMADNIAHDAP